MRADRLLALLMLLQARGQMSARALAEELEVSERTIYRDVDALSAAGVPVYGEPGREGGYALLDSYRTNLTGLKEDEVRALFMLSIPAPLAELGVSQELKGALLKLAAALPPGQRHQEERVRQRIHLDPTWGGEGETSLPHLHTIHQAVWQDRQLRVTYLPPWAVEIKQLVDPYGLVARAGVWYLVYGRKGGVYARRVSRLVDVRLSDERFERPADFDLGAFWREWCAELEESRSDYVVTVRVAPDFVPLLPWYFGEQVHAKIAQAEPPDAEGWITLELPFDRLETARDRILSFGRGMEVLEPRALRASILDYAEQIVALYRGPST